MTKVVATGKTIEEATRSALHRLQVSQDQVKVTVLQNPSKGFLGLFGAKDAVVEVEIVVTNQGFDHSELKPHQEENSLLTTRNHSDDRIGEDEQSKSPLDIAYQFLTELICLINIDDIQLNSIEKGDVVEFQLIGQNIGMLIGKHGHTLDSLQYLVNLVANRHS